MILTWIITPSKFFEKNSDLKKTVSLFLLLFVLSSCCTKKKIVDEAYISDTRMYEAEKIEAVKQTLRVDSTYKTAERVTIRKVTNWSPPDSTGTQYPTSTEEEETKEIFEQTDRSHTVTNDSTEINASLTIDNRQETVRHTDEKRDARLLPSWVWVVIGCVVIIAVIIVLFRFIKR